MGSKNRTMPDPLQDDNFPLLQSSLQTPLLLPTPRAQYIDSITVVRTHQRNARRDRTTHLKGFVVQTKSSMSP